MNVQLAVASLVTIVFRNVAGVAAHADSTEPPSASAIVADYHVAGWFDGVALVGDARRDLDATAVGLAERSFGVPCDVGTRFPIASLTKQFTAVLTLMHVERGVVDLDATIDRYLPESLPRVAMRITVEQLLTQEDPVALGGILDPDGVDHLDDVRETVARGDVRIEVAVDGLPRFGVPAHRERRLGQRQDQLRIAFDSDAYGLAGQRQGLRLPRILP